VTVTPRHRRPPADRRPASPASHSLTIAGTGALASRAGALFLHRRHDLSAATLSWPWTNAATDRLRHHLWHLDHSPAPWTRLVLQPASPPPWRCQRRHRLGVRSSATAARPTTTADIQGGTPAFGGIIQNAVNGGTKTVALARCQPHAHPLRREHLRRRPTISGGTLLVNNSSGSGTGNEHGNGQQFRYAGRPTAPSAAR